MLAYELGQMEFAELIKGYGKDFSCEALDALYDILDERCSDDVFYVDAVAICIEWAEYSLKGFLAEFAARLPGFEGCGAEGMSEESIGEIIASLEDEGVYAYAVSHWGEQDTYLVQALG